MIRKIMTAREFAFVQKIMSYRMSEEPFGS